MILFGLVEKEKDELTRRREVDGEIIGTTGGALRPAISKTPNGSGTWSFVNLASVSMHTAKSNMGGLRCMQNHDLIRMHSGEQYNQV